MPIVTHTLSSVAQANGSISYVLRLYDQDGSEYTSAGYVPAGFSLDTLVMNKIAETDQFLAENEFNVLVGS
jgi:hypothetical protein